MELLDRALGVARAVADRVATILKLPRSRPSSPEPFAAVEDPTPSADALLEPNAAPQRGAKGKPGARPREKIDLRAAGEALLHNRPLCLVLGAALLFVLAASITAIVVNLPAKPLGGARAVTREGAAVARRMIPPPETSFAPRMPMERDGAPAYTLDDAIELGLGGISIDLEALEARNDAWADGLYGAVR